MFVEVKIVTEVTFINNYNRARDTSDSNDNIRHSVHDILDNC